MTTRGTKAQSEGKAMIGRKELFGKLGRIARSSESGSAIVEMAISSTLIMTVFIAIFQTTMACYTYNSVCEASRESARWAAVRGSTCHTNTPNLDTCSTGGGASSSASATDIQNHAKTVAAINWSACTTQSPCVTTSYMTGTTTYDSTHQQTTTTWAACSSGTCNAPGNLVVVTINYPYTFNVPFVKSFALTLTSTSQMVVAQ